MKKKILLFSLIATLSTSLIVLSVLFSSNVNSNHNNDEQFSSEIMLDGDHYKIEHPIFMQESLLYISLPDLHRMTKLQVEEKDDELVITYQDNMLNYKNDKPQDINGKVDNNLTLINKNDIRYLPDQHIEKYLGIKVSYYLDKKSKTISLLSPQEQMKETHDQELGTTIFLHKDQVPLAKYEPRSGIYLGGYVIQDEFIQASMSKFNQITGKEHASYFRYVGYGKEFPTEWVNNVISEGGFPHIAWEPNNGLEEVQDNEYLRQFARDAKKANVPILLRYASEMNGTWTAYSGDPDLYKEKWKLIHHVMEEEAPNVMMLWNVFTFPEETIDKYYPGDEYVDYVGVNIYNVVYHNDNLDAVAEYEDPLKLLDYVYNKFSARKPIVIGEFGATNYTVTDGLYHVDFAEEKISRLYKYLPALYPRVKFIYYFDVNNLVNAPPGRKINNYAITENERITSAYASNINQISYLSSIEENSTTHETFSYRDFLFYDNGQLFVDIQFVEEYLHMEVSKGVSNEYNVSYNGSNVTIQGSELSIMKSAYFGKRLIKGISLDEIIEKFNLKHNFKDENVHIYDQKKSE